MRRRSFFTMLAVAGLVATLLAAGCTKTVTVTVPSSTPSSSPAVRINILDFRYSPIGVTIAAGTSVTWTNMGSNAHTATSGTQLFDSGQMQPGTRFTFRFDAPGT